MEVWPDALGSAVSGNTCPETMFWMNKCKTGWPTNEKTEEEEEEDEDYHG